MENKHQSIGLFQVLTMPGVDELLQGGTDLRISRVSTKARNLQGDYQTMRRKKKKKENVHLIFQWYLIILIFPWSHLNFIFFISAKHISRTSTIYCVKSSHPYFPWSHLLGLFGVNTSTCCKSIQICICIYSIISSS